jgi:hypothetical protein
MISLLSVEIARAGRAKTPLLSDISRTLLPVRTGPPHPRVTCDAGLSASERSTIMRVMNVIRMLLLGSLIVAGHILYPEGDGNIPDPASVTSLAPAPVTVTILDARTS